MSIEVRGARADEMPEVLDMIPRVMGATREYFASAYRNDPWGRPEHSRIVRVDGRIVSHIRLYDRWQRVGPVPVHVGCVGDVCTLPEYRQRGYCRALLEDALAYWEEHGYDLSMIVSGVGVYAACGWVPLTEQGFTLPAEDRTPPLEGEGRRAAGRQYEVRRFVRGEELPAAAAVYAAYNADRSLSAVRSHAYWKQHYSWITGEIEEAFLVAERAGDVVAYLRCEGGGQQLTIAECCYRPGHEAAALSLFDAVRAFAARRRIGAVGAYLPADHPVLAEARRQTGFQSTETSVLLFRLVNLRRLLERLGPLLAERARTSGVEGEFSLQVDGQAAALGIRPGEIRIAEAAAPPVDVAPVAFFGLLFGAVEPASVLNGLPVEAVDLLAALFPKGAPVYWRTDVV